MNSVSIYVNKYTKGNIKINETNYAKEFKDYFT